MDELLAFLEPFASRPSILNYLRNANKVGRSPKGQGCGILGGLVLARARWEVVGELPAPQPGYERLQGPAGSAAGAVPAALQAVRICAATRLACWCGIPSCRRGRRRLCRRPSLQRRPRV